MPAPLSDHRKRLLSLLQGNSLPLSAQNIYERVSSEMNLATVYRGLQYLEKEHLVRSFTVECDHEGASRFYTLDQEPHLHYFHCTRCHQFFPLEECGLETIIQNFQVKTGHTVQGHSFNLSGTCNTCREQAVNPPGVERRS